MISTIIKFYRIEEWYYFLGSTVLGVVFGASGTIEPAALASCLLVSAFYLAYAYSFNRLCDKAPGTWLAKEVIAAYLPLAASLPLALRMKSFWFLMAGYVLNILYSMPSTGLKRKPFVSTSINAYIFGILFLFGYFSSSNEPAPFWWMAWLYFSWLLVPAQLLHELAHAGQDGREDFIIRHRAGYVKAVFITVFISLCLAVALCAFRAVSALFLTAYIFWFFFLYRLFRSPLRTGFIPDEALLLRRLYRRMGFCAGIVYLISFYTA